MINPYLFVGVGGSGGKTLRAIKAELHKSLADKGWDFERLGFPITWQFLNIDTPANQGREGFPAEPLAPAEYLGLAASGQSLDNMLTTIESRFSYAEAIVREEVMAPLPRKGSFEKLIDEGAGQYRAIGRSVALARFAVIRDAVSQSLANMQGPMWQEHQRALAELFGKDGDLAAGFKPTIFLISSLAGGSGSGQFLEVSEAIKAARPSEAWAGEQIAILFAPDVFDDPKISIDAGIAPNSLAAVGELISAKWRKSPTEVSSQIYGANGFADFRNANYQVGPSDVFLFGKSAGNVVFTSQNEVYLATATSLAHWVTDPSIAEWYRVFQKANQQAGPDRVGLKVDSHLPMPLNALGFSRVTLGTELFRDYAIGRLSRATLERLVYGHELSAGNSERGETEEQKIDRLAKQNIQAFANALQIAPEQIAASIHSEAKIAEWVSAYRADMIQRAGIGGTQTQKGAEWISRIRSAFTQTLPIRRNDWDAARQSAVEEWATTAQIRINRVVVENASRYGLRTVDAMLSQVIAKLNSAVKGPGDGLTGSGDPATLIEQALQPNSAAVLTASHDAVNKAVQDVIAGARDSLRMEDLKFARKIIADMVANYLVPLRDHLSRAHLMYFEMVTNGDYQGTGENRFKQWPSEETVPQAPAQNIKLLMPHTEFKTDFEALLIDSTSTDSSRKAISEAVREILCGSSVIRGMESLINRGAGRPDAKTWQPFGDDSVSWMPHGGLKPASRWAGELPKDLDQWETIVEKYVVIPNRALGKHLSLNLSDWLAGGEDIALRNRREDDFAAAFGSALNMCQPFAKLNRSLLSEAHDMHGEEYSITVSQIPVEVQSASSQLPQRLKDALALRGISGEAANSKFKGGSSSVKTIDFFAALKSPVHHFVFDNLTQPIIQGWNVAKMDPGLRGAFMLRRRARLLPEAIPLAPEILEQLLRGWYVAQILGRLNEHLVPGQQGPKLSVHQEDPARAGWEALPFPLFQNSAVFPGNEYPALVAYSVNLALMECADAASLRPWSPYRSLLELGGSVSTENLPDSAGREGKRIEFSAALRNWITLGVPADLAPVPNPERAGTASMTSLERLIRVRAYLEQKKEEFLKDHVNLAAGQAHTTLAWQLRREILSALDTLLRAAETFNTTSSNV